MKDADIEALVARLREADAWAGLLNGGATVLEDAASALSPTKSEE